MFFGNIGTASSVSAIPFFARLAKIPRGVSEAEFQKRPDIAKKIQNFRDQVANIEKVDDFFKNRRVLEFSLSAYGMEVETNYPARIKQVMMSSPEDRYSVANRMADERYRTLMKDFQFATEGVAKLKDPAFIDKIVKDYVTQQFEKVTGESNPALTDALYFQRKIGTLTRTSQLYGDPVMFSVVKEALSISDGAVAGSGSQLTSLIEKGFDVSKVGDTAYVDRFIQRYLAMKEIKAQASSSNPLLGIFA
jgi:Protein of unknown function (DUF1217)